MSKIFLLCGLACCIVGCSTPAEKAYYHGNAAYRRGEYQQSFADYLYAANNYIVPAQYALAYQYFYGLGTQPDQVKAIAWFKKASYHSERARYALHLINQNAAPEPWTYRLKF